MNIQIKPALLQVLVLVAAFVVLANQTIPSDEGTRAIKYPPISTFESSCARCHGPHGSFYGESFGQLPAEELQKFVRDMMKGPSRLAPGQYDIEAMTAYNMALGQHKPFIFISSADTTAEEIVFSGESIPGCSLSLVSNGKSFRIKPDELGNWKTGQVSAGGYLIFIAANETDTVKLFPGKESWSN